MSEEIKPESNMVYFVRPQERDPRKMDAAVGRNEELQEKIVEAVSVCLNALGCVSMQLLALRAEVTEE